MSNLKVFLRLKDVALFVGLLLSFAVVLVLVLFVVPINSEAQRSPTANSEQLEIEPLYHGELVLKVGQGAEVKYLVHNGTRQKIRIIGATSSCTCTLPKNLPALVQPNEKIELIFDVQALKPGIFLIPIEVFTDEASASSKAIELSFRVTE